MVEYVQAPTGGWSLSSTAANAGKVITKLAAMGGLAVVGGVATNYLNQVLPGSGDAVNWIGAIAMLSNADPLGLLINGAVALFNTFATARQRTLDKDQPDKVYGTKFGRVRVGDKWYPAILESSEGDSGLFAQGNSMRMLYGEELIWVPDGKGGFRPEMRGDVSGSREFIVDDDVMGKGLPESIRGIDGTGKGYNDRYNPMRDWYWFDQEEASSYLDGSNALEVIDDEPYDNYYMSGLNDWRLAFHEMAEYSDSGN